MDFLTFDGARVPVERGSFRRLPDEVDPVSGATAGNWQAAVYCRSHAEANAIRALRSWNLRRTLSWQLRGDGHGDVTVNGEAMGAVPVVARLEVEGGAYPGDGPFRHHVTLSVRIREQVVIP